MRHIATAVISLALTLPQAGWAQVAKVMSVEGTAMLERSGQSPRIIGVGEGVEQKDVISVALRSNALLEFRDQTRITLRPNTVFRVDTFIDTSPRSMVLGLVKGGLRAVTGDIAKREPTAVRFQTNTAIIGVRGTEFDARLCEEDCAQEDRAKPAQQGGRDAARGVDCSVTPRPPACDDPANAGGRSTSDPGLYVWVHDGAVVLDKDQKTVDVPAGEAAFATLERLALLPVVPNFMRLDTTPRPSAGGSPAGFQLPIFRRPGGAVGMCRP